MNDILMARAALTVSVLTVLLLTCLTTPAFAVREADRETKQAELDATCEAAREKKLAPLRKRLVEECVENGEQPSRKACETFYADYGAQSGNRAPLFYDLPECVEAFEYQKSERGH